MKPAAPSEGSSQPAGDTACPSMPCTSRQSLIGLSCTQALSSCRRRTDYNRQWQDAVRL